MPVHLIQFLNSKVEEYNKPAFIKDDPISIPHLFSKKQDIEIAGFLLLFFPGETEQRSLIKVKS